MLRRLRLLWTISIKLQTGSCCSGSVTNPRLIGSFSIRGGNAAIAGRNHFIGTCLNIVFESAERAALRVSLRPPSLIQLL
jgi:hypothetical protein